MLEARFAQVDVHVDETWRDHQPRRVENACASGVEPGTDSGHRSGIDQNVRRAIEP